MLKSLLAASVGAAAAAVILSSEPRLVSFERLPILGGTTCDYDPSDVASLLHSRPAYAQSSAPAAACRENACTDVAARKPVRLIRDPYAGFSQVRVDTVRNEVVLLDQNRFNIQFYDRLTNTPPSAPTSEPKRSIGGIKTKSQFASDAYIDPKNGDVYAVNNDSLIGLNIFSRDQSGDVPAARALRSPYGSYGMAIDEEKQEMILTVQHDSAIMVFPKMARGNELPIRLIQGGRTQMADPHGIALDAKNHLLYVVNFGTSRLALPGPGANGSPRIANWPSGNSTARYRHEIVIGTGRFTPPSVTVFAADARGNAAPIRVIQGPTTQLNWPTAVSVDADRREVYVANDTGNSITVYSAMAQGDVAPIRVLKGPKSLVKNPTGVFVDTVNDELWVANFGNHMATAYKRTAAGDTAPIRVVRSAPIDVPTVAMSNPFSIAYDPTREEILVPN